MMTIPVGLGEFQISDNPNEILTIYGLGSCVGVGVFDPEAGIAGLLHAVLPESGNGECRSAKYVDSGIKSLFSALEEAGAEEKRVKVCLVGGANLLTAAGHEGSFNIGDRNIESAQNQIAARDLSICGEDVGGSIGRTMRLYVADGRITVRSMGKPERDLHDGGC